MKRIFRISLCAFLLLAGAACTRHKIIPDEKLAQIFHDAFLTNAYIGDVRVNIDSLNIYEPIFARYGYTTRDVYYTIDNVARRTFTRTVYADSLIRVGSLRDTARLRIAVDVQPGEYELRLKYLVDSLDRNEKGLRGVVWLENRDGGRSSVYSTTLRRNRTENFTRRFTVDTTHRRLHLDFLDFREKPLRPSVTVTGLEIDYIPTTSVAVDSLYRQQLDLRIFADEFLRAAIQADSL